jgi:hypothetical protein
MMDLLHLSKIVRLSKTGMLTFVKMINWEFSYSKVKTATKWTELCNQFMFLNKELKCQIL